MCTLIPTTFVFPGGLAPKARRVTLVGPFNGWDATAHPLTKTPNSDWAITVHFPAGRIVYGFDVDGAYWLDPFDEGRLPNGWGSEYSIRYARPSADTPHSRISAGVRVSRPDTAPVQATEPHRRGAPFDHEAVNAAGWGCLSPRSVASMRGAGG